MMGVIGASWMVFAVGIKATVSEKACIPVKGGPPRHRSRR
jgi:hypothetical protein